MSSIVVEHRFQGETGRYEFQRESVATKVISLLVSDAQVPSMVIDGDWGAGKTARRLGSHAQPTLMPTSTSDRTLTDDFQKTLLRAKT